MTNKLIKHIIPGPAGNIEALIGEPGSNSGQKFLGIICHPHPLHAGTMNNKVVTTLAHVFEKFDAVTIRFNFRGVGKSEGRHDYAIGELDDLRAVIDFGKKNYPHHRLLLAGFSFGAYIAARVATVVQPLALVTIAPAVHHSDYKNLPPIHFPWVVVQGDADEIVPPEQVFAWLETLDPPPIILKIPGVGHFFHGQLITLRDLLITTLEPILK